MINLIGIVLAVYVNILILPEIASTEEYGMFRWIERTGVLFANILIFGLHRTYIKFSSDSKLVRSEFDDAIFSRTTLIICATIVANFKLSIYQINKGKSLTSSTSCFNLITAQKVRGLNPLEVTNLKGITERYPFF